MNRKTLSYVSLNEAAIKERMSQSPLFHPGDRFRLSDLQFLAQWDLMRVTPLFYAPPLFQPEKERELRDYYWDINCHQCGATVHLSGARSKLLEYLADLRTSFFEGLHWQCPICQKKTVAAVRVGTSP